MDPRFIDMGSIFIFESSKEVIKLLSNEFDNILFLHPNWNFASHFFVVNYIIHVLVSISILFFSPCS